MANRKPKPTNRAKLIGIRTGALQPLVEKWMEQNPGKKGSTLLRCALKNELRKLAGKRYAHLVEAP